MLSSPVMIKPTIMVERSACSSPADRNIAAFQHSGGALPLSRCIVLVEEGQVVKAIDGAAAKEVGYAEGHQCEMSMNGEL
ncbi:hypothetical protein MHYP_G00250240 [Metynnis hypsauchen]